MKKWIWGSGILVVFLIAAVLSAPFFTMYQIRSGIHKKDTAKLNTYVEFEELRLNLKDQLVRTIDEKFSKNTEMEENQFSQLTSNFAKRFATRMVDNYISPEGLGKLMGGGPKKEEKKIDDGKPTAEKNEEKTESSKNQSFFDFSSEDELKLFKNASFAYQSPSVFTVTMPTKNNKDVQFVLTRKGVFWKLTNIILPIGKH